MKKYPLIALSLLACGFMSSLQAANLISNGSFEQTTFSGQTVSGTGNFVAQPDWTFLIGSGGQGSYGTNGNWSVQGTDNTPFNASQGNQFATLNGADWSSSLVSSPISLTAGQQYTFSFDTSLLAAYNGDWSARISPSSSWSLLVALQRNVPNDPYNVNYVVESIVVNNLSSWNSNSFTFTALRDDSEARISVYTLNGDNEDSHVYSAVDNFQLTAIPEPSTYALLMLVGAFGMISSSGRRRSIV
jgi:hypothetical protein